MPETARVLPFPTSPLRLVIIRTLQRRPLFGAMRDGRFHPSRLGTLARQFWLNLPIEYPEVGFEWLQVQPTAVVALVRAPRSPDRDLLRPIVAHYKALVTRSAARMAGTWEPGYEAVPVISGLGRVRQLQRNGQFAAPGTWLAPQDRGNPGVREK